MARRLGVPFEVVGYSGGAALVSSAKSGQWDIVFIGVPAAQDMDLSAPYVQIDMGYLVTRGLADLENKSMVATGLTC